MDTGSNPGKPHRKVFGLDYSGRFLRLVHITRVRALFLHLDYYWSVQDGIRPDYA